MMRDMTIPIGGENKRLVADFAASLRVNDEICDPLEIARQASMEAVMLDAGIKYETKFKLGTVEVVNILMIGLDAAKSGVSRAKLEEAVFEMGLLAAKEYASQYIALIVVPTSQEAKSSGGGDGKN